MRYTEFDELSEYINRCQALGLDIIIDNIVCKLENEKLVGIDILFDGLENYVYDNTFKFPDYINRLELTKDCAYNLNSFLFKNDIIVLDYNMIEEIKSQFSLNLTQYYQQLPILYVIYGNNLVEAPPVFGGECVKQLFINKVKEVKSLGRFTELELIEARSAEKVEFNGFKNLHNLKTIYLDNCKSITYDAFKYCESLEYVYAPKLLLNYANFTGCKRLKYVDLSSLMTIKKDMFKDCINLREVKLDKCLDISSESFVNCDSLEYLSLPRVKTLYKSSFLNCDNLKELYLPELKELDFSMFSKCYNLRNITVGKNTKISAKSRSIGRSFVVKVKRLES